ncbi:MAG TPA: hypothetical protein VFU21_09185 [Kofleriaceae bacterium]|nr:hypothetical protein [Kofleriaceae bacterium]
MPSSSAGLAAAGALLFLLAACGSAEPRARGGGDARCDPTRFLCQQIHRGAQATEEEKAECAGYEAVHGRVSAP